MDELKDMTQEKWDCLSLGERIRIRDLSGLTKQLLGLERCRVEVVDLQGERRRFIVGRSTGWRPCHLEIKTIRSRGGGPADREYRMVRLVEAPARRRGESV